MGDTPDDQSDTATVMAGDDRPVSPAASAKGAAKPKPLAKAASGKGKKGKVTIQDEEGIAGPSQIINELQQQLKEANDEARTRAKAQSVLEEQLREAKEKHAQQVRIGAKRLIQITALDKELETERLRTKRMMDELVKQTKMMDLVLNFRDQECAREVSELTHDNNELNQKLDLWRDRANTLQQERWGFVQKFRAAKKEAGEGNTAALDSMNLGVDFLEDSDKDGSEENDKDDDDDW